MLLQAVWKLKRYPQWGVMALSRIRCNVKIPQEARITAPLLTLGSWDRDATFSFDVNFSFFRLHNAYMCKGT